MGLRMGMGLDTGFGMGLGLGMGLRTGLGSGTGLGLGCWACQHRQGGLCIQGKAGRNPKGWDQGCDIHDLGMDLEQLLG